MVRNTGYKVNTAAFVAAGSGVRLKERTKHLPKGLMELNGVSLMKRSVDKLINAGIEQIYIGTGYLSEQYDDFAKNYPQIKTIKSKKYATTNSMYTLYNMRNDIKDDFLLLESDLLYDAKYLDIILNEPRKDVILASGYTFSRDEVFIETYEDNRVRKMSKNVADLASVCGELVGISKISIGAYQEMCRNFTAQENEKIDYEFTMTTCTKNPFFVKKKTGLHWCEIDDETHLRRALKDILPKIDII